MIPLYNSAITVTSLGSWPSIGCLEAMHDRDGLAAAWTVEGPHVIKQTSQCNRILDILYGFYHFVMRASPLCAHAECAAGQHLPSRWSAPG